MASKASPQLKRVVGAIEGAYKSAVFSGIVPDSRHLDNGGYHCSVNDLIRFGNQDDYSNSRPDDRNFNKEYSAAYDISMNPADMKLAHSRIYRVWADRSDPRRKYFNCVNCYDGSGDAVRLDFYSGGSSKASADHKWHNHGECRRRYVLDNKAADAHISTFLGESKEQWFIRYPADRPAPTTPTSNWTEVLVNALPNIKSGSKGDPVRLWQHLLILRGVVGTSQWGAYCDGDFGKNTTADTKELQKKFGLTQTGVVDATLWKVGLTGKKS